MNPTYTGGCLCGSVRYASGAEPLFTGNCHCRDCQRATGGPYTPAMFFPVGAVTITGVVRYYRSKADSGRDIERGFCPECGSQLFGRLEMLPGMLGVRAGTLDDPGLFKPTIDIYVESAAHWDFMNPDLPKAARSPRPS